MTLTEFLLARIAEDEARARSVPSPVAAIGRADTFTGQARIRFVETWQPRRVLAECDAKRIIAAIHQPGNDIVTADDDGSDVLALWDCRECRVYRGPCRTLRTLALPYAGHPDYCEEWRP